MSSTPMSLFGDDRSIAKSVQGEATAAAAAPVAIQAHDVTLREDSLQVATRLMAALSADERVIVVTACDSKDGAPDLASQLALGLARSTQEAVALVDADLRHPTLDQLFGASKTPGFAELAEGKEDLPRVSRQLAGGLFFIPAGEGDAVLPVPACTRAMAALRLRFRYVVIAAGPVLQEAGAVTLASLSDGVVLSLRAGKRRRGEVEDVQRELARVKARFLGAVLRHK